MRRKVLLPAIALAAMISASTTACADSGGSPTSGGVAGAGNAIAAPPPAVPVRGLTRGMVLPLEAYEESLPEYNVILEARLALEGVCMRGYGFSFAPTAGTDSISYDASNMERRYGLSDPAAAAEHGYAVALPRPTAPEPALSRPETLVLTGAATPGGPPLPQPGTYDGTAIPAGGCVGQADRRLGNPPDDLLADHLDQQSLTDSLQLPAVRAAIGRWSDCMRQHGYQATSPLTASLLTRQYGASPGDTVDRKIAVADVACKTSTNLIGIWFAGESGVQRQYIASNQVQLRQESAALTAAHRRAEAVLAR